MLSAIVLTRNEEKNIRECLESVKWCDKIVLVDDYSEDKTVEIAKKFGAKVYKRKLNDDFAKQRNFGLEKARGEWVLFVDADERVSPELAKEIQTEVQVGIHRTRSDSGRGTDTTPRGYLIKRTDFVWGRKLKHGEMGNTSFIRLAQKGSGEWKRRVHETWDIQGSVKTLKNPLPHYPHQTVNEFLSDINRYSTLHAQENSHEGKQSSVLKILLWPKLKFLSNWVLKGGFWDGTHGFVVAMMMSFHSFLSWGKLYLEQRNKLIK
ncbi:MAG: glycosyltransferase family 2 protein [Patescibacteria group bacterium]